MKRRLFQIQSLAVILAVQGGSVSANDVINETAKPLTQWAIAFISAPVEAHTAIKDAQEYARQGDYKDAEERLNEAKKLIEHTSGYRPGSMENGVLLYLLGHVQTREKHYDDAMQSFARAITIANERNLDYREKNKIIQSARELATESGQPLREIFVPLDSKQLSLTQLTPDKSPINHTILPILAKPRGLDPVHVTTSGEQLPDIRKMIPVPLGK
jgi:tetratricopeptide (TPR) repeat protein